MWCRLRSVCRWHRTRQNLNEFGISDRSSRGSAAERVRRPLLWNNLSPKLGFVSGMGAGRAGYEVARRHSQALETRALRVESRSRPRSLLRILSVEDLRPVSRAGRVARWLRAPPAARRR